MNTLPTPATVEVGARKVDPMRGTSNMAASRQWFARPRDQRFLSLSSLRDAVAKRAENTSELRLDSKKIEVIAPDPKTIEDTHDLWIGLPDGKAVTPTHWSFGQLCSLAGAPAAYLRKKPSQIVADNLIDDFRFRRDVEAVKLYHSPDQLYAATGPDYGRIYDREVIEAVMQVAGDGTGDTNWKVPGVMDWRTHIYNPDAPITADTTTLFASDRDVWVFLCDDKHPIEIGKLPDGSPDYVFRGFYITNSEMGAGSLTLAAFYLRSVCCNRIFWGVENFQEISLRHTKYAPSRFIEEARPALQSYAEGSSLKLIEAVDRAKEAVVAKDQDEALAFLQARNFSKRRSLDILELHEKEEGHPARSAWDMAQGITAFARSIPNNDDRVEIERAATGVLAKV